jgi:hypothetical protein
MLFYLFLLSGASTPIAWLAMYFMVKPYPGLMRGSRIAFIVYALTFLFFFIAIIRTGGISGLGYTLAGNFLVVPYTLIFLWVFRVLVRNYRE